MKINAKMRNLIIFGSGFGLGFGACFIALKTWFKAQAEEEISEVKTAFQERLDELEQEKDEALGMARSSIIHGDNYIGDKELLSDSGAVSGLASASAKWEKGKITDYTLYFKGNNSSKGDSDENADENSDENADGDLNELDYSNDHPQDDIEDVEETDVDDRPIYRSDGVLEYPNGDTVNTVERRNRPKLIRAEDFGNLGYEQKQLYFYAVDKILVDEDSGDILDSPEGIIGDALTKYGFDNNSEEKIYVRNDSFDTDYEIIKVHASYAD